MGASDGCSCAGVCGKANVAMDDEYLKLTPAETARRGGVTRQAITDLSRRNVLTKIIDSGRPFILLDEKFEKWLKKNSIRVKANGTG